MSRVIEKPERGKASIAISMAATVSDTPIVVAYLAGYSIMAVWTGTPDGTLKLQASNNACNGNIGSGDPDNFNASATWVDITGSAVVTGGAAGSHMWNVSEAYYQCARVTYTRTASTGSLSLYYVAKEV